MNGRIDRWMDGQFENITPPATSGAKPWKEEHSCWWYFMANKGTLSCSPFFYWLMKWRKYLFNTPSEHYLNAAHHSDSLPLILPFLPILSLSADWAVGLTNQTMPRSPKANHRCCQTSNVSSSLLLSVVNPARIVAMPPPTSYHHHHCLDCIHPWPHYPLEILWHHEGVLSLNFSSLYSIFTLFIITSLLAEIQSASI